MYRKICYCVLAAAVLGAVLTGCYQLPGEPIPTETPTQTATLTATPVWFPATATPTPLPTPLRTPTPDLRPDLGSVILEDAFELEAAWYSFSGSIGRVTFTDDHLTLAVNQPPGMIYAVREIPVVTDFYAEVAVEMNLCGGNDEFGLMLRVSGIRRDHYRFALTCDGQVKIIRAYGNNAVTLEPLQQFPEIPVGFPSQSLLAVWVVGDEMRFFVNDRYLYTVNDPVIVEGAVGVYVRTTGEDTISVNFNQLVIREILN
jgi:hypothetical protein